MDYAVYPQISDEVQKLIHKQNPKILEWISAIEIWLKPPLSTYHIDNWLSQAQDIADLDLFQLNDWQSWLTIQNILTLYESHFQKSYMTNNSETLPSLKLATKIEKVVNSAQTTQRTEAWYLEHQNLLTGSEIGDLFESQATRQSLIWSKIIQKESKIQGNQAVPYEYLTPFDWGHRFEPVVKMILEWKYKINIKELGRICHPNEPRLAASPDGIITSTSENDNSNQKLVGCLVEIKCPISRKPDGRIIPKYYHQIQLQLAVTELEECIFTEHVFISGYKKEFDPVSSGWVEAVKNGQPHGRIFIVEKEENVSNSEDVRVSHRYEYGPINDLTWEPLLDRECEHIVETMPWALGSVTQQHVKADSEWWEQALPAIRNFWIEVDTKRKEYADGKITPATPKRRLINQPETIQEQLCIIKLS